MNPWASPGPLRRAALALLALAPLTGCGAESTPPWQEGAGYRWRELRHNGRGVGFTPLPPSRTGVDFINTVPDERRFEDRNLAHGAGVALGDADGDGQADLYFTRPLGPNLLYRNLGGWRFEEVPDAAGAALADRLSRGAVFADVDGDADLDLLVSVHAGPNVLLVNDGAGRFDEAEDAGFGPARASTTLALADVDGDGDLDLYIANNKNRVANDLFSPRERAFEQVVRQVGDEWVVIPEFREHYRIEVEGTIVKRFELAEPDEFYLNDGRGRFREVSFTAGRFLDEEGRPLARAPREWGLTARFHDMDADGDPDLYVANDFNSPDLIYLNDGTGTFRAIPMTAVRKTSLSSMAVDFSDVDRDGDFDFVTTDMLARTARARRTQVPSFIEESTRPGQIAIRPQVNRNALQLNRGDATYAEIARYAGVEASDWTWGTMFLDVDLDGFEDLLLTNGHPWDQLDADTHARLRTAGGMVDWRMELGAFPPLAQRNAAFRNRGDLRFEDVSEAWGFGPEEDMSHGLAAADLDGDGDLDVVAARLEAPPAVYRNDSGAPRVAVRLRGRSPNTQGVGARIEVRAPSLPPQLKEVSSGGMYLSGSDPLYGFAAGSGEGVTIRVGWPSGARSEIDAAADRLYEIREPEVAGGPPAEADREGAWPAGEARAVGAPFFADVSEQLGHRHVETPFDEFERQPLIPLRLSQLGPGVTWQDVDADGDEDLLVAGGRGGGLALFRNQGGAWTPVTVDAGATPYDQTTVLGLPGPRGGVDLLVGQMNYEAAGPEEAAAAASVLRLSGDWGGGGARIAPEVRAAVPGARSSTGPIALADYDGDGDLDLFVGGRVAPTVYPTPASSRLLLNREGEFGLDGTNSQRLAGLGLASAATFSDVDLDGDPDLIVAVEWGPIRLFLNRDGRFSEATEAWGLAGLPGRWNGVATGDLNADGRPEIVATAWGENLTPGASTERPLFAYFGDLDGNGTFEVVSVRADAESGRLATVLGLGSLSRGLPYVRRNTPTHAAFADATLAAVLGSPLETAPRLEARTLSHTLFLNRGERFEAVALPPEAQFAPAFYAGVADFDGDGHDDVFLAQNFFATDQDSERYDAGLGLWLRGDGSGALRPVPATHTGIRVYGDSRGAGLADFDGDGRVDLAVSQNGASTRLFRNRGASQGVRVRLVGPPANPEAVGAAVWLVYRDGRGPTREIQSGSGYWSRDGAVQVLGVHDAPLAVRVRWPGGVESEARLAPGQRDVTVQVSGAASSGGAEGSRR